MTAPPHPRPCPNRPAARPARAWTLLACLLIGGCATIVDPKPGSADAAAASSRSGPPALLATPSTTAVGASASSAATPAASAGAARPKAAASSTSSATAGMRLRADSLDDPRRDLWERIRDGMRLPDLEGDLVRKWEQWYASRPEYVARMTERGSRYLFHIVEEVDRRGLPSELALLPFIESAFNPQAVSTARAAGMWQFMPATGKDFELRQNLFRDDRRDVLASTRAALDYLERLHARFGDWALALAAYNWGQGNVQRAVDRNLRAGLPADYESLQRLPLETREYVPKLQAVKNIVLRPEAFGLELPPIENHPYFLTVTIERDIDLVTAARLSGLGIDEFRQLNPQHHKPVILAAGTPQVLLPYDNANRFLRELAMHQGALASWTAWVAPRTLKPAEAARTVGEDEARLREVNRIPPRMMVKAGSTLLVPRGERVDADVPGQVADGATIAFAPEAPPLRKVTLKAKKGETVASVARRYRVSAVQVAQWNDVGAAARFAPGQTVVVMVPARRAAAPTRVSATRVAAAPAKAARRVPAGKAPTRVRVAQR